MGKKPLGYFLVPYQLLKKTKESIFARRFMLYKKKECERRRRYRLNKIKDEEFLNQAKSKHRCSYCRGLYWEVYYYRGYMLCSFCFVKKDVLSVILFSVNCKEICNDDIFFEDQEYIEASKNNNKTSSSSSIILPTPPPPLHRLNKKNKKIVATDGEKEAPQQQTSSNITVYDTTETTTIETTPFTLSPDYLPHYDRDYWTRIGLSMFL